MVLARFSPGSRLALSRIVRWAWVLLLAFGCQTGQVTGEGPTRVDEPAPVARAAYVPAREGTPISKTRFVPGYARLPIFLNPNGGTYAAGADDAESGRSSAVRP